MRSKINMLACLVSDESSLPCLQTPAFLLCPYIMEKEWVLISSSSYKDTNLIMVVPWWLIGHSSSLVAQTIKPLPTMRKTRVQSLGQEDPLEKEMATHSSSLARKIPWTEEPGRLQSTGSQRVGHDWASSFHFTSLQSHHGGSTPTTLSKPNTLPKGPTSKYLGG